MQIEWSEHTGSSLDCLHSYVQVCLSEISILYTNFPLPLVLSSPINKNLYTVLILSIQVLRYSRVVELEAAWHSMRREADVTAAKDLEP